MGNAVANSDRSEMAPVAPNSQSRSVIEAVPNAVLIVKQDGVISFANQKAKQLFGYEASELTGLGVEVLLPPSGQPDPPKNRSGFFSNLEARSLGIGRNLFAVRRDGSRFPVEIGHNPIEFDGLLSVLCSIVDITGRKRTDQTLEDDARLKAVLNTVVDGLITIDQNGTINSFNAAAEKIFGYTEVEAKGQNVSFLMPEPSHNAHDGYLSHYKETGLKSIIGVSREVMARRKDGSVFPIELAVGEMFLHDRRMYVGILRDITARKQIEDERLQLIADLKQSNQDLDDFAYIASHDLKEPLRGVSNNANFLKEDYADRLDEAGAKRLDRISFLCRRTEKLIDDLLYFSRLGRQQLARARTDFNLLVHDIWEQLESAIGTGVEFRMISPLPSLVCDSIRIGEVFRNLITNAVKYNNRSEKLVEIGYLSQYKGESKVFYVKDNGIGIRPEFQKDVFTIFKRLHSEDDSVRGSGVGLTFAKKIVERHGGHIWLESQLDLGSTFYFSIKEEQTNE